MAEMGRFIKPILSVPPPDPGKISPMEWLPLTPLAKQFRDLPRRMQTAFIQLMTMSAADFLDQWFETEPLKATMSASGIIGTFQGPRSPGHRLRAAAPLHGRDRRRVPRLGRAQGRHRRDRVRDRRAPRSPPASRSAPRRRVAQIKTAGGKATGVVLESGEEIEADVVMSSLDSRWTFIKLLEDGVLDPAFRDEVLRYKYRGSSGKVNLALDGLPELACKPGQGRVAARRDLVLAEHRLHRARLRRREVRAAVGAPVHRLHHADARRSRRWRLPAST